MTDSTGENDGDNENITRVYQQRGFLPRRVRIKRWWQRRFNRKPAYRITRNGVVVRYFNFSDTDSLPFDLETYQDTQIFIGSWANPWYVDIDSIEKAYPDFTKQETTEVSDVFGEKHVYPSQRWKMLANQHALQEMFEGRTLNNETIQRLLYAVLGGLVLIGLFLIFGG